MREWLISYKDVSTSLIFSMFWWRRRLPIMHLEAIDFWPRCTHVQCIRKKKAKDYALHWWQTAVCDANWCFWCLRRCRHVTAGRPPLYCEVGIICNSCAWWKMFADRDTEKDRYVMWYLWKLVPCVCTNLHWQHVLTKLLRNKLIHIQNLHYTSSAEAAWT